jgi:hypothetical protein
MSYTFTCPLCDPAIGHFERTTEFGLAVAIATHIERHMNEEGLRAVNAARLKCTETSCSLGMSRVLNTDSGIFEPRLTAYDLKFLNGMKIKVG